ncbi:unnamed protein product [Vitrella brassicaformis CCMP3155]|uniref:Uncharacterized protein n=1 Tax=Vitrella brassicaformis (strain CCMP3155) TaxID=1169540 RepID=A0A0G4G4L0_VITBC|nr:unnamed protein product [Vitrella brassicaformis CCMP3155]|eukprot:CEM23341.1 unnamed protein product [Vitrella brassicaformis CCMP3155]
MGGLVSRVRAYVAQQEEDAATRELAKGLRNGTLTLERATQLLEARADAKFIMTDWDGYRYSLIQLAIERHKTADSLDIIRLLIDRGADINHRSSSPYRPIAFALTKGRYDVAHMLLDDPNLDIKAAHHLLWRVADDARDGSVSSAEKLRMAKRLIALEAADQNPDVPIWQFCSRPLTDPSHHLELIAYLFHKAGQKVLRAAYRDYLRHDLPMQVSIAVKTALLPARALATTALPDGVIESIEALIGVGSPPALFIPIGEQPFGNRINELANGYLSAAYKCIRQAGSSSSSSSSLEGMGSIEGMVDRYDDLMRQVREAAKYECCQFCPSPYE